MSVWRWAERIEPVPPGARISLGEGNTPLIRSRRIGPAEGIAALYFKLESTNPTGSYKDRFAAVAVSLLKARGKTSCVATSSGNTGAALAAYCAAADIPLDVVVVEQAPPDKLRQMLAYGAEVCRVRGFGIDPQVDRRVQTYLQRRGAAPDAAFLISAYRDCPGGMTGIQTIAYELAEQLPAGIDHVFCCAGSGGLVLGVARGFAGLVDSGDLAAGPAVECVQPEGNATIAGPLQRGGDRAEAVACKTRISGLQVPSVIDGDDALRATRASGGTGHLVTDEEAWQVQQRLALEEGLFCEPAAAVPLAGALRAIRAGAIRGGTIVCVLTGSGFKDGRALERMTSARPCTTLDVDRLEAS